MTKPTPTARQYQLKPRRRTTRKTLLLLIVGVVGGHQGWGWHEDCRLNAALTDLRGGGEPVWVEEFQSPRVPESENAVTDLRLAGEIVPTKAEDLNYLDLTELAAPLTPTEALRVRRVIETHAAVLRHVRTAATKAGVDWGHTFESPVILARGPDLYAQRNAAEFLGMAILLAHHDGDDAAALRLVRDMLFISRAVDEHPTLSAHLTAAGIVEEATTRLAQITPSMRIGAPSASAGTDAVARPATAEQVRTLIAELLDAQTPQRAALRALRGERAWQQDSIRAIVDGRMSMRVLNGGSSEINWSDDVMRFGFKPLILSDGQLLLQQATVAIEALDAADCPAACARVEGLDDALRRHWWRHVFALTLSPSYSRYLRRHHVDLTNRRLAATALAARWYAAEHAGELPGSLDRLVASGHLPSVPFDPMASSKPLGYFPGATSARIYGVGDNGKDDGGSTEGWRSTFENPRGWLCLDLVIHLTPQPRPLVDVSTKPVDSPNELSEP